MKYKTLNVFVILKYHLKIKIKNNLNIHQNRGREQMPDFIEIMILKSFMSTYNFWNSIAEQQPISDREKKKNDENDEHTMMMTKKKTAIEVWNVQQTAAQNHQMELTYTHFKQERKKLFIFCMY